MSSNQCFGSGSMWIRIEMAPLDLDSFWEYGSGSRTVKKVSKKGKKSEILGLKEHRPFCRMSDGFYKSLGVLH